MGIEQDLLFPTEVMAIQLFFTSLCFRGFLQSSRYRPLDLVLEK